MYMAGYVVYSIIDFVSITFIEYHQESLDSDHVFILWNIIGSLFTEVFLGMFLPIRHMVIIYRNMPELCSWKIKSDSNTIEFYVRRPELIPRRYFVPNHVQSHKLNRDTRREKICKKVKKSTKLMEMINFPTKMPDIDI